MKKKAIFLKFWGRILTFILSLGLLFSGFAISGSTVYAQDESQPTQEVKHSSTKSDSVNHEIVQGDAEYVDGQVIVKFNDSTSDKTMMNTLNNVDSKLEADLPGNDLVLTDVPEGETVESFIETMEEMPTVEYVQPNYIYKLGDSIYKYDTDQNYSTSAVVNDPYIDYQWYLDTIDVYDAWDYTMGSSDVRVAVIDTGIDLDHPEFAGRIYANTDTTYEGGDADDDDGHGTHVAGIIAANANNSKGVAGIAPGVDLIAVDVFAWDEGDFCATTADIIEGIDFAELNGAKIINLSLGGYYYDAAFEGAVNGAVSNGIIVICAAGNEDTTYPHYPSDFSASVGVIATDAFDDVTWYTDYGWAKDISAPGGDDFYSPYSEMLSTLIDGEYGWGYGTSMAAPVVSGVAALVLSEKPDLTVPELKNILYETAVDLGDEGKDIFYGNGRVDAYKAVLATGLHKVTASSAGYNSVKVSWNEVVGASGYLIYRATSSSGDYTWLKTVTSGDTLSYTNTGLMTGKKYYYKVRYFKETDAGTVYSDFSSYASATPVPSKPTVKVVPTSYNSIKVSWDKISGASGYVIYRATSSNGEFTWLKTVTSGSTLSYTNTGLTTGKRYYYKVRAYRQTDGGKVFGNFSLYRSTIPIPSTPTAKAASAGYNKIKVSWNKISGASGYVVYRATSSNGKYTWLKTITSGSTLSYTNTGLTTGKKYYYKVQAYRKTSAGTVKGNFSSYKYAKPIPSKPTIKLAYAGYRKAKVSWSKVSGASGYAVYRATSSSGKYTRIKTVTSGSTLSYTNTGLTKGKKYYYKVRAYRKVNGTTVYGTYSSIKSYTP